MNIHSSFGINTKIKPVKPMIFTYFCCLNAVIEGEYDYKLDTYFDTHPRI